MRSVTATAPSGLIRPDAHAKTSSTAREMRTAIASLNAIQLDAPAIMSSAKIRGNTGGYFVCMDSPGSHSSVYPSPETRD